MKFVIQRVTKASVEVEEKVVGEIEKGFMVLIGVCEEDTTEVADKLIKKMMGLRIFEDSEGKTNLALDAVEGSLLLVSQFTLYANCKKGYRPSFIASGSPDHAKEIYDYIVKSCKEKASELGPTCKVETGIFGAEMKVTLVNDGPFTIILDSKEL